ncbi:TMEM175 family protein [Amycolatopsis sp. FBCC-B4732]|uniref:TMEM175 family protein n=1 Tax=Amycolatopsis sp. FBCC-B4732 TaxID=3079339 RepID=UPI001FF31619|nr:TMEM175 family protein [Amycolatopsis sp. FBCC-B4732]UOX86893.1 TMEM175 family protein [Amycolatopsis sp. FBCC-B4732]
MSSVPSTEDTADAADVEPRGFAAERLTFFSDAVVAIAITLLALELPLPEGATSAELLRSLGHHQSEYISFLISFVVIGGHWRAHHRLFDHVTTLDGGLIRLSFGWLLTQVIMPFATKVIAEDGGFEFRFVFYALVQVVALTLFLLMARRIQGSHHYRADTPPELFGKVYRGIGTMAAAFVVSIPVAFFTHWAYACWIVVPFVVNLLFRLRHRAG